MQLFMERHYRKVLLLIWVACCLMLVASSWNAINEWRMGDPDDQMRLLEVRDWLAGQSWWDVTQYRMNLPEGGPMHWSRLVDVPIAAAILLLEPFVGIALAEHITAALLPLLTLGVILMFYAATARRLFGPIAALVAASLFITILPAVVQVRPMRIDHHGWQLALFFVATLNLFDRRSPIRAAVIIGAALALWIEISVEGLPFAILMMGVLGLRWLMAGHGKDREADNYALPVALISLALTGVACFGLTEGWSNAANYCDSLSPFHIAAFVAAAVLVTVGTVIKTKLSGNAAMAVEVIAACAAGIAGISLVLYVAPQCAGDAFSQLDPLVREYWFNRGLEGLPLWSVRPSVVIQEIAGLVGGGIGLIYILLRYKTLAGQDKIALTLLFVGSAIIGSFVSRTTVYALCLGTVMLAAVLIDVFAKVESLNNIPARMGVRICAMLLAVPSIVGQNTMDRVEARDIVNPHNKTASSTFHRAAYLCQRLSAAHGLERLPKSVLMVGLDTGPAILLATSHSVIATGHHRNATAMVDVIRTFTGSPEQAERIIRLRKAGYLVMCDGSFELAIYQERSPQGFLAQLRQGIVPTWLERQVDIGPFQIFRVVPEHGGGN